MMKHIPILPAVWAALLMLPVGAAAQQPAPTPGHDAFAYFEGAWSYEIEEVGGGTYAVERVADGFFFRATETWRRADEAPIDIVGIYGYDPASDTYSWYRYWSNGYADHARGWLDGDTWTWLFDEVLQDGKPTVLRFTGTMVRPAYYTFQWERSVQGRPWEFMSRGASTRVP